MERPSRTLNGARRAGQRASFQIVTDSCLKFFHQGKFTVIGEKPVSGLSSDLLVLHLTFIPPFMPCWLHFQNFTFGIFIFIFIAHPRERQRKNHMISWYKIPWHLLSSETKITGWEINSTQSSTPSLLARLLLANHWLSSHQGSFNSLLQFMAPTGL